MTNERTDACQHCGGKLLVYSTRHTEKHKVQYLRCKDCHKPGGSKRTQSEIAGRLSELEKKVETLTRIVHI